MNMGLKAAISGRQAPYKAGREEGYMLPVVSVTSKARHFQIKKEGIYVYNEEDLEAMMRHIFASCSSR
jgi:hypothetical protein